MQHSININRIIRSVSTFFVFLLIIPVKLYQYLISPFLPNSCRFEPTCSEYTIQALRTRGVFTGLYLSVKRILRCHPFGGHGYDPVPPPGNKVLHFSGSVLKKRWRRFIKLIKKKFYPIKTTADCRGEDKIFKTDLKYK